MGPHAAVKVVGLAVAVLCVGVVAWLVLGTVGRGSDAAVDELPTVAEVIAAQAHAHGVSAPTSQPLPSDQPSAASTLTAYEQMRRQLVAVATADGASVALAILSDAAKVSPEVRADCLRLYDEIRSAQPAKDLASRDAICPNS